jgi:hypothetical protein
MDQLPVSACVKTGQHILRAARYISLAAVGMLLVFSGAYALIWLPPLYKLISPVLLVFGVQITILCLLIATTILKEASLRGPAIIISRQGLLDNRSKLDVRWTDVRSIQLIGAEFDGCAGVTLGIRDKKLVPAPGWRMRFIRLRTGRKEIHCSLLGLDKHQTYLAELMAELVEQAGGVIRSKYTPTLGWRDWLKQSFARWRP